jgi:hypothetical protein
MDLTGQPGGGDKVSAIGGLNASLLEILKEASTDEGKRATDQRTRTVWL